MVMTRDEVFRATGPTLGHAHARSRSARRTTARSPPSRRGSRTRPAPSRARRWRRARCASSRRTTSRTSCIEGYDVVVNKPKVAAYRAPGAPMSAFAIETVHRRARAEARHRSDRDAAEERRAAKGVRRRTVRSSTRSASSSVWKPRRAIRTTRRRSARTRVAASAAASGSTRACSRAPKCRINEDGTVRRRRAIRTSAARARRWR